MPDGTPIKSAVADAEKKDQPSTPIPATDNRQPRTDIPTSTRDGGNVRLDPLSVADIRPQDVPLVNHPQQQVGDVSRASDFMNDPTLSRAEKKARLAVVLDRGIAHDRLKVNLPADVHGEWVRNDPFEINRMRFLGFEIDKEYAPARSLHGDGTGSAIVGDVIFMTTSKERKDMIDEVRKDQFFRVNGYPGDTKNSREERELAENVARETGGQIPTFTESRSREARKEDIAAALDVVERQTTPATEK